VLATLQSLPAEIVSKRGGPVKTALKKGAIVILKAEQANLQAVMGHLVDGERRASTGLLLKSLIATRGKPPSDGKGERYLVRVKRGVVYPSTDAGKPRSGKAQTTAAKNAARLEYGTSKQPAEPFIRPAFLANAARAIDTIEREVVVAIDRVVNKLAAQNKGK
jgi:HK97 gp10 family phage protein